MAESCSCVTQLAPIIKGDDATIVLVIIQPDGSKMNFNGKTIKFIIKKNKSLADSSAIVLKTYQPTEDCTQISIKLTKQETDVEPGSYYYGIRLVFDEYQTTEGEGKVEIKQGPFYGE